MAMTCLENHRKVILAGKNAPAARKKTPTGLLHVTKIPGTQFLRKKKSPAARKKTSPGYHSQLDLAIFVIGHAHIQFEV